MYKFEKDAYRALALNIFPIIQYILTPRVMQLFRKTELLAKLSDQGVHDFT